MRKMKPKYTPVKRDTPLIEECETVARKNKGKERTDCRHNQRAARGVLCRQKADAKARCSAKEHRRTLTGSVLLEDGAALEKHRQHATQ